MTLTQRIQLQTDCCCALPPELLRTSHSHPPASIIPSLSSRSDTSRQSVPVRSTLLYIRPQCHFGVSTFVQLLRTHNKVDTLLVQSPYLQRARLREALNQQQAPLSSPLHSGVGSPHRLGVIHSRLRSPSPTPSHTTSSCAFSFQLKLLIESTTYHYSLAFALFYFRAIYYKISPF